MIHTCPSASFKALRLGALLGRSSRVVSLNRPWRCSFTSIGMEVDNGVTDQRGALIVLEGLDRSGKTSQSARLVSYLEGTGHSAELWRFPDRTTSVGQMISAYLSNESQLDDRTIHLLFSANRWEKRSLMESKLRSGTTLIVDRYSYSGVAFSSAKGLDLEWCKKAAERGGYGGERYEQLEFQKKVAECYHALHDSSWKMINACQPIEDIEKQLQSIVLDNVVACKRGRPISHLWSR
ncbi:Thymidylate kinase [Linum perenne]